MRDHIVSRDTLYAQLDALEYGVMHGDTWAAHAALLDRLAANRRAAESNGWTSCALERIGGFGRLTAWGVPPGDSERHPIPDWLPDRLLGEDR